jgi:hypothetical protein
MEPEVAVDLLAGELFSEIPSLPRLNERWTTRRKAAVIEAVRGGWVPIEEMCRTYSLSVDEFLAWERDIDRTASPACARRGIRFIGRPKRDGPVDNDTGPHAH